MKQIKIAIATVAMASTMNAQQPCVSHTLNISVTPKDTLYIYPASQPTVQLPFHGSLQIELTGEVVPNDANAQYTFPWAVVNSLSISPQVILSQSVYFRIPKVGQLSDHNVLLSAGLNVVTFGSYEVENGQTCSLNGTVYVNVTGQVDVGIKEHTAERHRTQSTYVDVEGSPVSEPKQNTIYVRRDTYSDGEVSVNKVVIQ